MLSRRAPVAVSDAFQWLVGARFATTVAARVKSGSGAKSSSSANVLTATRVGELARLAAERYDYNDMVVSSAQNIKFTFALSQRYVNGFAHGLHAIHLRKGHKFGVFTPTEPEALIYTLSLAALGVETVLGPTSFIKERDGAALRETLSSRPLSSFLFESLVKQMTDASTHEAVKAVVPELGFIAPGRELMTREFPKLLHVLQTDRQQWGNLISSFTVPVAKANPDRYSEFVNATSPDAPILSPALPAPGNLSFTQSELIATSTHLAHSVGFAIAERVLFITSNADTVAMALQLAAVQSGATLVYSPQIADAMTQSDLHHCTTIAVSVSTLASIDLASEAVKRVKKVIIVGASNPDVAKAVTALESRGIAVFIIQ